MVVPDDSVDNNYVVPTIMEEETNLYENTVRPGYINIDGRSSSTNRKVCTTVKISDHTQKPLICPQCNKFNHIYTKFQLKSCEMEQVITNYDKLSETQKTLVPDIAYHIEKVALLEQQKKNIINTGEVVSKNGENIYGE